MSSIVISTGGTGGHVIPAKVFYDYFKKKLNVKLISDKRGLNFIDIKNYNVNEIHIPQFKKNLNIVIFPFFFISSFLKSLFFLKKENPKVLLSTGGYMSIPHCLAAKILNIKIFLFEPNLVIGRSNLFLLRFCKKIFAYEINLKNLPLKHLNKLKVIKPIVRKEFLKQKKNLLTGKEFKVLIIGGSQTAKKLDKIFLKDILKISKMVNLTIYHQTSKSNQEYLKSFYQENNIANKVFTFENNISDIMLLCDFAITRAGASTLSELVSLKIPFLAIPFPFSKDDHQYFNAKFYVDKNFGWLINENEISEDYFYKFFTENIYNKKMLYNKAEKMNNFIFEESWFENFNMIEQTFYEN